MRIPVDFEHLPANRYDISATLDNAYLQLASQARRQDTSKEDLNMALQGLDPVAERERMAAETEVQQATEEILPQVAGLDDSGFRAALEELRAAASAPAPTAPQMGDVQAPGGLNVLASAIAGARDPRYAGDYMALALNEATKSRDANFKAQLDAYNAEVAAGKGNLAQLGQIATLEQRDLAERGQNARFDAQMARDIEVQNRLDKRNEANNETRRIGFKSADDRAWLTSVIAKSPAARYMEAINRGYSEGQATAIGNMTPAELAQMAGVEYKEAQTKGQILKNEAQRIVNEFLPMQLQGKLDLNDAQITWLETRTKHYPDYLRATMMRVEIARSLAANTIGNTQFDNQMALWKVQNGPAIDALKKELDAHVKERAKIESEIGTKPGGMLGGVVNVVSGRAAKETRLQKLDARITEIQGRLDGLTDLSNLPAQPAAELAGTGLPPGTWNRTGALGDEALVDPGFAPAGGSPAPKPAVPKPSTPNATSGAATGGNVGNLAGRSAKYQRAKQREAEKKVEAEKKKAEEALKSRGWK